MNDKTSMSIFLVLGLVLWAGLGCVFFYFIHLIWVRFGLSLASSIILTGILFSTPIYIIGSRFGWWEYLNRVTPNSLAYFTEPVGITRGVFCILILACVWFGTLIAPTDYDAVCEQLYETTAYSKGIANLSSCRYNQRPNSLLTIEDDEPVFTWQSDFNYGDFEAEFNMQNWIELDRQPAQMPAPDSTESL